MAFLVHNGQIIMSGGKSLFTPSIPGGLLNGLMSYWKLDETSGINAIDSLGNTDLSINGATQDVSGKIGTSYSFATDQYVGDIDTTFELQAFSTSFWMKSTQTGSYGGLVTNYEDSVDGWDIILSDGSHPGEISVGLRGSTSSLTYTDVSVNDDKWHHIVFTHSGTTQGLYLDGSLRDSDTWTGTIDYAANGR